MAIIWADPATIETWNSPTSTGRIHQLSRHLPDSASAAICWRHWFHIDYRSPGLPHRGESSITWKIGSGWAGSRQTVCLLATRWHSKRANGPAAG